MNPTDPGESISQQLDSQKEVTGLRADSKISKKNNIPILSK